VIVGRERHENGFGVTMRREWFAGAGAVAAGHGDRNGVCVYTNWSAPKSFKAIDSSPFAGTMCRAVHPVFVNIRGAAAYVDKSGMRRAPAQPAAAVTSQPELRIAGPVFCERGLRQGLRSSEVENHRHSRRISRRSSIGKQTKHSLQGPTCR